ncbi:hypothetical protein GCM10010435_05570 [Winogradskya consettensis]|uniref:Uncharacterized protein n=1 Tax=Winogradskya consettensis TaxID=113560 RepID=A0A919SWX8_9ACTN|nr:hypothetical protein Aco04nite_65800 [Actinoplanes consettensis]
MDQASVTPGVTVNPGATVSAKILWVPRKAPAKPHKGNLKADATGRRGRQPVLPRREDQQ